MIANLASGKKSSGEPADREPRTGLIRSIPERGHAGDRALDIETGLDRAA
jgi:hypothetical protein